MGIELRITSSTTQNETTTSVKQINETDITVGCYNDDNIKLESRLLQGSHIRLTAEWNADTDQQRLIITNISGNTSIFLDGEALESDEYREINETTEIRLGQYTLIARDTSLNYFATAENATTDFALENFSPNEFSLDSAMQTLLQPTAPEPLQLQDPIVSDYHSSNDTQNDISDSTIAEAPLPVLNTIATPEPTTNYVATSEIPTLHVNRRQEKPAATTTVVNMPSEPGQKTQDSSNVALTNTEEQTLFEGVVGSEDIIELNFDAYRLYSISGRIIHHNQPLADVVLDGGPLGITRTNSNGNFCFENIVEGSNYQINVSMNGYMMANTQVLFGTVTHNIEHNLNAIKLSRVTGRIIHDGTPLPSVTLDAGPYGICLTDANGYYHFDNVPENTDIEIRALGAGFMFKRSGTASGASRPAASIATPNNANQEMEESLAALVGNNQHVA